LRNWLTYPQSVDLVEPGHDPMEFPWAQIVTRQVFCGILP